MRRAGGIPHRRDDGSRSLRGGRRTDAEPLVEWLEDAPRKQDTCLPGRTSYCRRAVDVPGIGVCVISRKLLALCLTDFACAPLSPWWARVSTTSGERKHSASRFRSFVHSHRATFVVAIQICTHLLVNNASPARDMVATIDPLAQLTLVDLGGACSLTLRLPRVAHVLLESSDQRIVRCHFLRVDELQIWMRALGHRSERGQTLGARRRWSRLFCRMLTPDRP